MSNHLSPTVPNFHDNNTYKQLRSLQLLLPSASIRFSCCSSIVITHTQYNARRSRVTKSSHRYIPYSAYIHKFSRSYIYSCFRIFRWNNFVRENTLLKIQKKKKKKNTLRQPSLALSWPGHRTVLCCKPACCPISAFFSALILRYVPPAFVPPADGRSTAAISVFDANNRRRGYFFLECFLWIR